MPGPVTYVTDAISNGRRESLNTYVKELLALPPYISQCALVRELFAPREGDYELDPDRVTDGFRNSGGSQESMGDEISRTASRQSSQGRMNGGINGYSMGPPPQKSLQPNGIGAQAGGGGGQYRNPSEFGYQGLGVKPQPSTLTQGSSNSSHPNASTTSVNNNPNQNGNTNPTGAMKIKVNFQDETVMVRVPTDISFQQLRDKCKERLKIAPREEVMINYRDESSGQLYEMLSDRDLDTALHRNARLVLLVQFV